MMNYEVRSYLEEGKIVRKVRFEDGKLRPIQKDEQYGDFFYVKNPNTKFGLFGRRIKDAYDCIVNGDGDVISVTNLFGSSIHVMRFLDRSVGEELRQKTIDGYKDTKFAYCLEAGNKNSMSGYHLLDYDASTITGFHDVQFGYRHFPSEEEALAWKEEILFNAREAAQYILDNFDKDKNNFHEIIEELNEKFGGKDKFEYSILYNLIDDLIKGDISGWKNENHQLIDWNIEVTQCCVPDRQLIIDTAAKNGGSTASCGAKQEERERYQAAMKMVLEGSSIEDALKANYLYLHEKAREIFSNVSSRIIRKIENV